MSTLPLTACPPARADDRTRPLLLVGAALLLFWVRQMPFGQVLAFDLPDNDDIMRLVQVRDFLAGQGWFDTSQHRFLPPLGAAMHWSRFIDLPIAGLILAFRPLLGERGAEVAAITAWPVLVFLAYLGVIWTQMRPLFGVRAAGLACIAATQGVTLSLWGIGRIDHHNVQATAIAAAACLVADPRGTLRRPAGAGLLCAFSLGIGLETVPFVAVVGAGAALAWWWAGRGAAPAFAAFGAALGLGSLGAFAVQVPPSHWFVPECDTLSAPWLVLTAGGGLGAVLLAGATGRLAGRTPRLGAAAGLGIVLAGAFALGWPACLAGPYGALPEIARTEWLAQVLEAVPAARLAVIAPVTLVTAGAPLVAALALALDGLVRGATAGLPARRARVLGASAACSAVGLAVMVAQLRGVYIGAALVPVVAGWALDRGIVAAERADLRPLARVIPMLLALATLGTLWSAVCLAVEAVTHPLPVTTAARTSGSCAQPRVAAALDAVPAGLVLASTELGSSLLVATRHAVVSAPYHRNGDAIVAGLMAERGREGDVRDAMRRFGADYLLVCADWVALATDPDILARRLAEGASVPWLEPVPLAGAGGLRLWRIRPAAELRPTDLQP